MAMPDRPEPLSLEDQKKYIMKLLESDPSTSLLEVLSMVDHDIAQKGSSVTKLLDQETIDAAMNNDEY